MNIDHSSRVPATNHLALKKIPASLTAKADTPSPNVCIFLSYHPPDSTFVVFKKPLTRT